MRSSSVFSRAPRLSISSRPICFPWRIPASGRLSGPRFGGRPFAGRRRPGLSPSFCPGQSPSASMGWPRKTSMTDGPWPGIKTLISSPPRESRAAGKEIQFVLHAIQAKLAQKNIIDDRDVLLYAEGSLIYYTSTWAEAPEIGFSSQTAQAVPPGGRPWGSPAAIPPHPELRVVCREEIPGKTPEKNRGRIRARASKERIHRLSAQGRNVKRLSA